MCGIAGLIAPGWTAGRLEASLQRMVEAIAHRGPDGAGTVIGPGVALGHARLAIIDIEGGAQPMTTPCGRLTIVYNGEIYNFRQLREELAGEGSCFRTRSDTEVLLRGYERWGDGLLTRLRGMFAFALYDASRQVVLLARDPFGIKPLLVGVGSGVVAFGSELTAIEASRGMQLDASPASVERFLRYGYIPGSRSIYRQVFKLLPGHAMEVSIGDLSRRSWRYFRAPPFEPELVDEREAVDKLEQVLDESVRAHMVADVPFGVFLSGGIDSTLVAASMVHQGAKVTGYAIGFEATELNELPYARQAAQALEIDIKSDVMTEADAARLPEIHAANGEPFGDSSILPTYFVSALARRDVPMVLSGDGGDELFGGYLSYAHWLENEPRIRRHIYRALHSPDRRNALSVARMMGWAFVKTPTHVPEHWEFCMSASGERRRRALWRKPFRGLVFEHEACFDACADEARGFDPMGRVQHMDLCSYLPGDILTKVDIASMAHGLEVRVPLIDLRVLEFSRRLAPGLRFGTRAGACPGGKPLLKQLLARRLPLEFVNRRKTGFGVPLTHWMRPGSVLGRMFAERVMEAPDPRMKELFEPAQFHNGAEVPDPGETTWRWHLLCLSMWLERHPRVGFGQDHQNEGVG